MVEAFSVILVTLALVDIIVVVVVVIVVTVLAAMLFRIEETAYRFASTNQWTVAEGVLADSLALWTLVLGQDGTGDLIVFASNLVAHVEFDLLAIPLAESAMLLVFVLHDGG